MSAEKRLYNLFYKVDGRYYCVGQAGYTKTRAVHVYQDALLNGLAYHACLRPYTDAKIWLVVVAAYGRSYTTAEAALKDWKEGKDFQIMGGRYCSNRDGFSALIRLNDAERTLVPAKVS